MSLPHTVWLEQAANGSTLDYLCDRGGGQGENKINTHYQSSLKSGRAWYIWHRTFIHAKQLKSSDHYQRKKTLSTVTQLLL